MSIIAIIIAAVIGVLAAVVLNEIFVVPVQVVRVSDGPPAMLPLSSFSERDAFANCDRPLPEAAPTAPSAADLPPVPPEFRCSDDPSKCAAIYHAFDLSNNTIPSILFLWRAVLSALSVRRAHHQHKEQQIGGMILVTNLPRAEIAASKRKFLAARKSYCVSSAAGSPQAHSSVLSDDVVLSLLSNSSTLGIAEEVTVSLVCGPSSGWPFTDHVFLEAPFIAKPDALSDDAVPVLRKFFRVLYLDADTFVLRSVFPLLDSVLVSDVVMSQEFHWASDIGPYLYAPVLHSFDDRSWSSSTSTTFWWLPHHAPQRKMSKKKAPFGRNGALFEVQYNTGVIGFSPRLPEVQSFFRQWSARHRASKRCKSDRVLSDQCSLAEAIRRHTSLRVSLLSDRANFREALGRGVMRGSSGSAYARGEEDLSRKMQSARNILIRTPHREHNSLLQRRVAEQAFPAKSVIVLHLFEIKHRQDEWMKHSAFWKEVLRK